MTFLWTTFVVLVVGVIHLLSAVAEPKYNHDVCAGVPEVLTMRNVIPECGAITQDKSVRVACQGGDDGQKMYYYGKVYTMEGVLRRGKEDLCETGVAETFYYLEVKPINASPTTDEDYGYTVTNATRLQVFYSENLAKYLNRKVKVTGELMCHIAGCHIHTDVYMMADRLLVVNG